MRKGIIVITKHFPFNKGETPAESYLENEIITLAAHTERIFVLAAEAKKGAAVTCRLPDNVEYAALQSYDSKIVKMGCFAKSAALYVLKKPGEAVDEIKTKKLNFKRKLFLYYFIKRALQKLRGVDTLVSSGRLDFSKYDTIYSFWFFDNAYMALLLKNKYSLNNYKVVSRAHGYDLYEYRNRFHYIPLRRYLLANLDRVFTCSDNGNNYLTEKFPEYKNKIKTSFLGSNDCGIQPYKRKNKNLYIASCSRVVSLKRVNRIVECLSELEKTDISLEWTHFGDGELFKELKEFAEKKLKKTFFHLKGNISNQELMKQYLKMNVDIFLNVSESEGLPISIMEAASFGIPIVATDVGGTKEIVNNGKNGYLIDKDFKNEDLTNLLVMISKMSDDDYMRLRKNSRNIYVQNFECMRNVEKFLSEIGG